MEADCTCVSQLALTTLPHEDPDDPPPELLPPEEPEPEPVLAPPADVVVVDPPGVDEVVVLPPDDVVVVVPDDFFAVGELEPQAAPTRASTASAEPTCHIFGRRGATSPKILPFDTDTPLVSQGGPEIRSTAPSAGHCYWPKVNKSPPTRGESMNPG